ncbi:MAG: hypothetical protein ACP5JO_03975 [Candidatus Ratteibacteria bacterium]
MGLSRGVSLDGFVLKRKIRKREIFIDWDVVDFMTSYRHALSESTMPSEEKMKLIKEAISTARELEIEYFIRALNVSPSLTDMLFSFSGNAPF